MGPWTLPSERARELSLIIQAPRASPKIFPNWRLAPRQRGHQEQFDVKPKPGPGFRPDAYVEKAHPNYLEQGIDHQGHEENGRRTQEYMGLEFVAEALV